jgi:hypothetical protein
MPSGIIDLELIGPGWVAPDPSSERRGGVTEKKDLVPVHVWTFPLHPVGLKLTIAKISGRVMVDYTNHRQRNYLLATKLYTQVEPLVLTASNREELNPEVPFCSQDRRELFRDGVLLNAMVTYANTDLYDVTDLQAVLSPARVRGFSFVEKRWSFF